jgi:ADP-L-glycero-D-manno-heptose 6-epimerase
MIAITGAAGFIGSNLAHRIAGMGHHLLLVDHCVESDKAANWAGLGRFDFIAQDLFVEMLHREAPPIEAIFYLGACSSTTETNWNYLQSNNVNYSQRLWEWCARHERPFYYASSAATYGDGSLGFDDRIPPERLRPLNLYGKSKNDFDAWALTEATGGRRVPPSWAGLKFFNVYGPRESHKGLMASVVWHARRQILANGEVALFRSNDPAIPDGDQHRDFVFVEDCIDHLIWLWEHSGSCGLFNSGTGISRTFNDLAKAVFAVIGQEPRIRYVEMTPALGRQYQNYTQADMSKLGETGYSNPPTSLEEGVRRSLMASTSKPLICQEP